MMRRQHGIALLRYIKGNIWLLIIPFVRGILSLKMDFLYWIKMSYMDIIVILIMFSLAWLKWRFVQFSFSKKEIYVKTGLILKREITLPYSVISCATYYCPMYFKPVKAIRILLETDSYSGTKMKNKQEIDLIVTETDYTQIYKIMTSDISETKMIFRASKREIILYSMCFSSTIPGIVYLAALIIQGSRITGKKFEVNFLSVVNEMTKAINKVTEEVVTIVILLLIIIAVGWIMSFLVKTIRNFYFQIGKIEKNLLIEKGYISSWKYYVKYSSINDIDMCQNLLMKITKIMSVCVNCAGYGKKENEQPVFIPMISRERAMSIIKAALPDFTPSNNLLRTKRTYIMAYIWLPLFLVIGVAVVMSLLCMVADGWKNALIFIGIMLEIPLVYLLIVKIIAKMSAGIDVNDKTVTISYCRVTRYHTVVVPKDRIAYIEIRRTVLQRASGCCDVIIYTRGECVKAHRVRGMVFTDAIDLVENHDKMC